MANLPEDKVCSKCRERKPLHQYGKDKARADGLQPRCNGCRSADRTEHKDERAAYDRQWRTENPAYMETWRRENKPSLDAYNKEYRAAHPGQAIKDRAAHPNRDREYRAAHPGKAYKNLLRWIKDNPSKWRAQYHRRRARLAASAGAFTAHEWDILCAYYRHRCLCCDQQVPLTVDHVIPISAGGANTIDNIQPLCRSCNSRKNDRAIDYREPASFQLFLATIKGEV